MTSRRRLRSMVRLMFTDGFRAAPAFMTITTVLTVTSAIASVAYVVGFKVITEAALSHNSAEIIWGAVLIAVLYTVGWAFQTVGFSERSALGDRVRLYVQARMAELVTKIESVEHFERPDYLHELDQLRENTRLLGAAPAEILAAIQTVLSVAVMVVLLVSIAPILVLLPLFGIPPVIGSRISVRLRERADERVAEQRRLANELFTLTATAAPAKELRLSGLQEVFVHRYRALGEEVSSSTTRAALLGAAATAVGWLIFAVGFVGGVLLIVIRAANGGVAIGEVVLAVSLLRRAQMQVGQSANLTGQLATTARTAKRFLWLEDFANQSLLPSGPSQSARSGKPDRQPMPTPHRLTTGISLTDVTFQYPRSTETSLEGITLSLPAGATVALVGENGAGKTTLVKLLSRMYRPTSGSISVDGLDLAEFDPVDWRSRVSAIFQDFVPYQLLAAQTVGVGDLARIDDHQAVGTALERANATEVVATLPNGLLTRLGKTFSDGEDLSGGQWQKLALGRGMMRDLPLLLVLDEPTANLDAPTESALFERWVERSKAIAEASGGVTVLVSHRFSTVRMANLVVVMDQGRIIEQGTHRELLGIGGRYAELYELQARSYR